MGACRELTELRDGFAELLTSCRGQADARYFATEEETERVQQLLQRLAPVAGPGCCPVCTQPLPESARRTQSFCTTG
jgi:DNA repair exonuclease SbcCD ATPase subunit